MNKLVQSIVLFTLLLILSSAPSPVLAQTPPPPEAQTFQGDQFIMGDNYELRENQTLNGNLIVLGGNVNLEAGSVLQGDIVLLGGNVSVLGEITGSVIALGATISLDETTIIRGDVLHAGGNITGLGDAKIYGEIKQAQPRTILFDSDTWRLPSNIQTDPSRVARSMVRDIFSNLLQVFGVAILAVIVLLIFPKPVEKAANSIVNQPLLSGATGLLTFLVIPVVVILFLLLMITIILIPVSLAAYLVISIAIIFGWITVGFELGRRIASLFKTEWAPAVSAGLGTLTLGLMVWLLGYALCLGGIIGIVAACLGLGGVILSQFGTQEYAKTTTSKTIVPAPPTFTDQSQHTVNQAPIDVTPFQSEEPTVTSQDESPDSTQG
jgi:hypothetical protein